MVVDIPVAWWTVPGTLEEKEFQILFSLVQMQEGKIMERRKKIALELSELVVYCRPVPFDEDSKNWERGLVGSGGEEPGGAERSGHRAPRKPHVLL